MHNELEWPYLKARREQSSLTFFYKIHTGPMSLNEERNFTHVTGSTQTSVSKTNNMSIAGIVSYSDAVKNSFFNQNYSTLE